VNVNARRLATILTAVLVSGATFTGTATAATGTPSGPAPACTDHFVTDLHGPVHHREASCLDRTHNIASSSNWSGFATTGSSFTAITGSWTVPSATGSGESSAWIGIDGLGNKSLIQTGTEQRSGTTYAWWEILPASETQISSLTVHPGDHMYAAITKACSGSQWTITLIDQTSGGFFSTQQSYGGPMTSAEWIMEAPADGNGNVATLAQYSTFSFDGGTLNGANPALSYNVNAIQMVQNGKIVSTPSGPDGEGDGFTMGYGSVFLTPPPRTRGYAGFPETFQPVSEEQVYVLGSDRNLWLENGPSGTVPPPRVPVDACVRSFQSLGSAQALVLGMDGNLWLESNPFGPAHRVQVDGNVAGFQAIDANTIVVQGTDDTLWIESAPFGHVPPSRTEVDRNVEAFRALSPAAGPGVSQVYVLGTDGKLWQERAPFGTVPPARSEVDGTVDTFDPVDANSVDVLGTDGKLWQERAPFGTVPPARSEIDVNVDRFRAMADGTALVLGTDGKLWDEKPPFGTVPPARSEIDANVVRFVPLSPSSPPDIDVLGSDGRLWLEQPPYGTVPPSRFQVDANVAR
jgi:hypothetical protein